MHLTHDPVGNGVQHHDGISRGSGDRATADATDLDAEVGLTDADAGIPDAIADAADAIGDSDISLDTGPDAAEIGLADLGTVQRSDNRHVPVRTPARSPKREGS